MTFPFAEPWNQGNPRALFGPVVSDVAPGEVRDDEVSGSDPGRSGGEKAKQDLRDAIFIPAAAEATLLRPSHGVSKRETTTVTHEVPPFRSCIGQ